MITCDLSILITCFQKEKYLEDAIASIKRQTKQPLEIILVHDACDTPAHHPEATTIILPKNVGVCKARDIAFKYCRGKLVLFLDGDDMLSPDYLEKMILTIFHGADITYPDLFVWNGDSSRLTVPPRQFTRESVSKLEKIPIPVTSMMKREVYEKLGGFKEMTVLEDTDFWVRALLAGFKMKKSQTLLWYRQLPENRNHSVNIEEKKKVMAKIMSQIKNG